MILSDIKDWLKTLNVAEHYYTGKLDNKQDKSLGVYQRDAGRPGIAIGGLECTKHAVKRVSLLLHWNENAKETEIAAMELYDKLTKAVRPTIGEEQVYCIMMQTAEPEDVGTDDNGIYERVIWMDIYHERR